jgi:hypothetical protein
MGQHQNIDLLLAPGGATGDPRSRFSIAARRSDIDGSPAGGRRAPLEAGVTTMEAEETTTVETGAVVTAVEAAGLAVELPSSADISGRGDDSERKGSIRMDRKAGNGCAIQSNVLATAVTHAHSTSGRCCACAAMYIRRLTLFNYIIKLHVDILYVLGLTSSDNPG